jgi:hypothetical protein
MDLIHHGEPYLPLLVIAIRDYLVGLKELIISTATYRIFENSVRASILDWAFGRLRVVGSGSGGVRAPKFGTFKVS